MSLVYVAGPFRAETAWGVERNVRVAEEIAYMLWMNGIYALCPHTNTRFFNGEGSDHLWIQGTLEMLRRCDAVVLCPNWMSSEGTIGEVAEAQRLKLPIFEWANERGQLLAWARERSPYEIAG